MCSSDLQGQNYFESFNVPSALIGDNNTVGAMVASVNYYPSAQNTINVSFMAVQNASQNASATSGINNRFLVTIPEITEDGLTTASAGFGSNLAPYWVFQYDQNLRQFVNTLSATTVDKIGYELQTATGTATGDMLQYAIWGTNAQQTVDMASKESKWISPGASTFKSVASESAEIQYAKKLGYAHYVLGKASANATGNSAANDYKVGDTALNNGGYIVTVNAIKTGGTTGGNVSGVENLAPSIATADSVIALNTGASPLVVLDTNPLATGSASVVSFGGQLVNSVSASALSGAPLTAGGEPMVKVFGNKIVVAGYDAAGTTEAASALITWLNTNRDNVRA